MHSKNQSPTVLCIDDEAQLLALHEAVLSSCNYTVLCAAGAKEGLEIFRKNHIDAVVLDFYMRELDGGFAALEMKRERPLVPILLHSGYSPIPKSVVDCVDAFVAKSEPVENFLFTLAKVIEEYRSAPRLPKPEAARKKPERPVGFD